jgi:hypothetical protein
VFRRTVLASPEESPSVDCPLDMRRDTYYATDKASSYVVDMRIDTTCSSDNKTAEVNCEKRVAADMDKEDGEYINLDYRDLETFLLNEITPSAHVQHQQTSPPPPPPPPAAPLGKPRADSKKYTAN